MSLQCRHELESVTVTFEHAKLTPYLPLNLTLAPPLTLTLIQQRSRQALPGPFDPD